MECQKKMKETTLDFSLIQKQIESNEISMADAVRLIAEDLSKNPKSYHLSTDDEDVLSDVTLNLLEYGNSFLRKFDGKKCTFKTYVQSMLKYQTLSVIRKNKENSFKAKIFKQFPKIQFENLCNLYEEDEAAFKFVHKVRFVPGARKVKLSEKTQESKNVEESESKTNIYEGCNASNSFNDYNVCETPPETSNLHFYWNTVKSKKAKTTLILALKSSYYLTDEHITSVSKYCKISKKLMNNIVFELKKGFSKKQEKIELLKERRAKSFGLHLKLQQKIFEAEDEYNKSKFEKKYAFNTRMWQSRTECLNKNQIKLCPTNKQIARLLGICERQICNYIKDAKLLAESIKKEVNADG